MSNRLKHLIYDVDIDFEAFYTYLLMYTTETGTKTGTRNRCTKTRKKIWAWFLAEFKYSIVC